jgi:hypothetical protein
MCDYFYSVQMKYISVIISFLFLLFTFDFQALVVWMLSWKEFDSFDVKSLKEMAN